MHHFALIFSTIILFLPFRTADAAWPDSSQSRVESLRVLRMDIGGGMPVWQGSERQQAYQKVCNMEKSYRPICKSAKWTENRRGDLKQAGQYFASICNSRNEPLACVVSAWNLGFFGGIPSNKAKNPKLAVSQLEKACVEKSYGPACAYWADFFMAGVGVKSNIKQAVRRYREACKAKDNYGCAKLATLQMYGQGIPKDTEMAEEALDKACLNGMGNFCADLGLQHLMGVNLQKDEFIALDYFEKGCQSQDGRSCLLWSAEIAQHGGQASDAKKAFTFLNRSCKSGQKRSCELISDAHEAGVFAEGIHVEGPGYLTISADTTAKIFIDGKFVRQVPLFRHKLMNGTYRIYIVHPDGRTKKMTAAVKAGVAHAYKWSFTETKWELKDQRTDLWRLQAGLMLD